MFNKALVGKCFITRGVPRELLGFFFSPPPILRKGVLPSISQMGKLKLRKAKYFFQGDRESQPLASLSIFNRCAGGVGGGGKTPLEGQREGLRNS